MSVQGDTKTHGQTGIPSVLIAKATGKGSSPTRLFGHDVFISFALGAPPRGTTIYGSDLARRLREHDLTVFFSEVSAAPGSKLAETITHALRKSRMLVVIVNRETLREPRWVRTEVETFRSLNPKLPVVPVDTDGCLKDPAIAVATKDWLPYADEIWLEDQGSRDGTVGANIVDRLLLVPHAWRANTKWRVLQGAAALILTSISLFAYVQKNSAELNAALAHEREQQALAASKRASEAAASEAVAASAARTARAEAERDRDIAIESDREARRQRDIAQTNAALSRARELAAHADNSLNQDPERSLILAIEAVNTSLRRNEPPVTSAENALQHAVFASLSRATLQGHEGHVNAVALSPDGTRAATGGADNTARIWDTATGAILLTLKDFAGPVNALSFSPDGKRLVTATQMTLGFTPDGQLTKTGRPEESVSIWDAGAGKRILTLQRPLDRVTALALSADGRLLATANGDKTQLWNALTGQERLTFAGHGSPAKALIPESVKALSFSHDSRYLATANADRTATIWDTSNGREMLTIRDGTFGIASVAFSPDGKFLATAADSVAKLWDTSTGRERASFRGHEDMIGSVGFSPDGRFLATGSWDKTARIWDLGTHTEFATMRGHADSIVGVVFSTDGRRLATASWDGTARIWDAASGPELITLKGIYDATASNFSSDGARLAASSNDNSARVWDLAKGKEVAAMRGHSDRVAAVAFSPDGKYLATGSQDGTAKVWDTARAAELATLRPTSSTILKVGSVSAVAMSADNQRVATGVDDGTVTIFDRKDGHELFKMRGQESFITALAFSPDGMRLASGSYDKTVNVWSASNGSKLLTLSRHSYSITKVVFSPDGKRLATSGQDGSLGVWDAKSGRERMFVRGHQLSANDVVFSPDSTQVATASTDGTVKIWDAATGQELLTLHSYLAPLYRVAFQRDGRHLAASSFDRVQTYTFDIQELLKIAVSRIGRRPPVLTPQECRQYFHSPSPLC